MMEVVTVDTLVERIEALVEDSGQNKAALRALLSEFHPADIAEILDDLSPDARLAVFNLLPRELASEVLDETDPEVLRFIFQELPDDRLAVLLEELPMDDAARLLSELPEESAQSLIELMDPEEAADVRDLLSYDEYTAGRLMTDKFARLRSDWTIGQALDYLRHVDPETESISYLYVVDGGGRLVGVVPLRKMLTAKPTQMVGEIALPRVISVTVDTDREELAETVAKYDFSVIPVVDHSGRLVGIVTVDDVVDILEEEATEDIQRLGGSEPLDQPYFAVPILTIVQKRVGWLLLLFVGGTLSSTVIRIFEEPLAEVMLTLNIFIPLLIGTGGNAGSQTVSTIIRAVAVGDVEWHEVLRVILRELTVGLLIGGLLATIGFTLALLLGTGISLAIVVALTIPVITTWANTVGSLVPMVAEKVGVDPAVVSAPLITTVVDATGLAIYFLIAQAILGL